MFLRKTREDRGLFQKNISDFLKIPESTYRSYESGKAEPNIATLIKLADFFDCSVDYLLGHQSSNILQLDSLTAAQHELLKEIKNLSDEQVYSVIGYVARLKEIPLNEIIEKIKNGG